MLWWLWYVEELLFQAVFEWLLYFCSQYSINITLLIERKEFIWILSNIFPSSTIEFGGITVSTFLACRCSSGWSTFMRSRDLFSAKISRHRIHSSLIHVILINLDRVPIIKSSFVLSIYSNYVIVRWICQHMFCIIML